MINTFFPSKKKPVVLSLPVVHQQQQQSKWVGSYHLTEEQRATKRGLSVEEYRHRVAVVSKAQAGFHHFCTDIMWPVKIADAIEHGKVMIRGIVRHYDDYGDVEWHEPPFILSVSPLKEQSKIINCTANWVTKTEPVLELGAC